MLFHSEFFWPSGVCIRTISTIIGIGTAGLFVCVWGQEKRPTFFECTFHATCVRLHSSAFVCVQNIKCPDAFRHKWISASGCVFCSRTFRMYYRYARERLSMAYYEVMKFPLFGCEDVYRLSTSMAGIMEGVV